MIVSATVHGDRALMRRLDSRAADRPIRHFLAGGGMVLVNGLKTHARVSSGTGRRSHHLEVRDREAVAGTNLLYMKVMARGRGAGKPMPPRGSLLPWMRREGIPADREYLIRRAIGRKGIKGDDYDVKAAEASIPEIRGLVSVLAREIVAEIVGG